MQPKQTPDQIMEQVLCGDRPADDPEFQRVLQDDSELRARWERMRSLADSLDEMGSTQRAILAGDDDTLRESEEHAATLVREHLPPARRPGGLRRWGWIALAAAGLALIVWTNRGQLPADDTFEFEQLVLSGGSSAITEMTATALDDGSYLLAWTDVERALGRTYVVHLHEHDGAQIGAEFEALRSEELLDTHWTFSPPASTAPESLAWSVEVRDSAGNSVAVGPVQAFSSQ